MLVEKLGLHGQEPCDVADSTLGQGEQQMEQERGAADSTLGQGEQQIEQLDTELSTHPRNQDLDVHSHSHTPSLWSPIPQSCLTAYGGPLSGRRFDSC